jgi:glycine/D-amino acid oxidase-like deaminating enzyme
MASLLTRRGPRVVVVGAGAFGGWTALELVRRGARVTLVDAWGAGNPRSSSGGSTRVIRASYGSRAVYARMAARAIELWRAHETAFRPGLVRWTGGLWLFGGEDRFATSSAASLGGVGLACEWLSPEDAARRHPQMSMAGIRTALWEPGAGYVFARRACEHVAALVAIEGGACRQIGVRAPMSMDGGRLERVVFTDGTTLAADSVVFACGPWLGAMFPDAVGHRIVSTRQAVLYFMTPPGDRRFLDAQLPVWVDFAGDRIYYGIPGNDSHAFKVADDTSGPAFDPTDGSRALDDDEVARTRAYLRVRFPALADAPLAGGEVCQYAATADSDFVIDRHPVAANVWIAGGGSGHGFKMGPVVGEIVAAAVLGEAAPDPAFRLARLPGAGAGPSRDEKWS